MNTPTEKHRMKLQRLLLAALLFILLPAVGIQAWFSYLTAQDSSVKFQEQLASEVSARIFDKVLQFFEVPRLVVRYNAEQFLAGTLDITKPQEIQRHFVLQLGQQPMLTFLSMGNAEGEYFAASRPPLGEDKTLRILQAIKADGRVMSLYSVNALGQRGELISHGNPHFDARLRPWFKTAVDFNSPRWYSAYRYVISDPQRAYDTMGIGMAAPLYDANNDFVGVVTADVALVQLSELLATITKGYGGVAFLFDEQGDLLATSALDQPYELQGEETLRIKAANSPNPFISAATQIINEKTSPRGRALKSVNRESYLLDWWQYTLPEGPTITIASMLPKSEFDAPTRNLFLNVILFSTAILLLSLILSFFLSKWIAKPLIELGEWATKLGRGEWDEAKHRDSPIAEVESLSKALQFMAQSVKYHTDNLEKEVAIRTADLERLNTELAKLSNTDGLSGLANRRYFDEILKQEISRARRYKESLALIMLDIDHFKKYNDLYGHQAGDDCIIRVANVLKSNVRRPSDLAARYGGEEFVVIASHCDAEDASALTEILRQKIEQLALPHELSEMGIVSASFGVAVVIPDEHCTSELLIGIADKALYKAKEHGRNRIEIGC